MPEDNRTPARQFRLPADTLALMDALAEHHGLASRTAVIRHLVVRAAIDAGLRRPVALKKVGKKSR